MTSAEQPDDEHDIVTRAQSGDDAAFRWLVDTYDRRLLYFVRRLLNDQDTAFDVLQTVWLNVYRRLRRLRSTGAFRVWLYRITHDAAVSELRRQKRRVPIETQGDIEIGDLEDEADESAFENAELVHLGLQRLSVDHRRVLTLRFLEDMKIDEIAEVLRCKQGTVKSRLYHARQLMRRHIEEMQND